MCTHACKSTGALSISSSHKITIVVNYILITGGRKEKTEEMGRGE